jgi:uncharacterized protein DUF3800
MHKSDAADEETAAVRLYLDESGGDDPGTPQAVVAGMIINRSHYLHFEEVWDQILDEHGIEPPLHMKEFGRPHGRFAKISDCCRRELFIEVAALINSHKIFSIAGTVSNSEYKQLIPKQARDKYSLYAMCFNLAVMLNHHLALGSSYQGKIPFILDTGNPYKGHIVQAHAMMLQMQRERFLHAGGLHFEDDTDFGVLQAADVIAWGARRRATNLSFNYGFSPITKILELENHHVEFSWQADWLKQLGQAITRYVTENPSV